MTLGAKAGDIWTFEEHAAHDTIGLVPGTAETSPSRDRVIDIMTRDPITVPESATLDEARRRLQSAHVTGLPVTDSDGTVVGVVTQTDLVALARFDDDGPPQRHQERRVREAMASPALTIGSWAPVREAARLLLLYKVHRLVVVDEEHRPVGILSTTDFVRLIAQHPPSRQ